MRKTKVKFDRPYQVGPCILELSRLHMYIMLYDYVKKYGVITDDRYRQFSTRDYN